MASSRAAFDSELAELDGYLSPTEFDDKYVDDGVDTDMRNVVVVDNLPVIPEAKAAKLLEFVSRIYTAIGKIVPDGIFMPVNKVTQQTEGFAFVEFATAADAEKAVASTNDWDFDKSHKLRVNRYTDFVAFTSEPDNFEPPSTPAYVPREDLYYWLLDEGTRDELVIRWASASTQGDAQQTEVLWADTRSPPSLDYGGARQRAQGRVWTERHVRWSPRGAYLATFHPQGLVFWAGRGFQDSKRFAHSNVTDVAFSPDDRYVLTWNGYYGNPDPERAAVAWDVRTQTAVRTFKQLKPDDEAHGFGWSSDSKYLARVGLDPATGTELVAVYEMPSGALLDQRSTKAPGARDLTWSPRKGTILAWWAPENNNAPTSVTLMRLPSREIVRQRNLFNVDGCELHWHPEGSVLAVLAAKANKKRKGAKSEPSKRGSMGFTVELVRLKDKNVPVDVLDVPGRVLDLKFEPGTGAVIRFALVTEATNPGRFNISFYALAEKGGVTALFTLEDKIYNSVHWSPRGEHIVFAATAQTSSHGSLEFFDVEHRKSFATPEHAQMSGLEWDPSGRMVATSKVQSLTREPTTRETVQNGYMLWSFQGTRLHEAEKHKMYSLSWRPRPSDLLTEEEAKQVARDLKKHISRFTEEDKRADARKHLLERLRKRQELDKFRAFLLQRHTAFLAEQPKRVALGAADSLGDVTIIEQVVEVDLGETIEIVA